jgi:hypothetical protein
MSSFEVRAKRAAMSDAEIKKFVSDFTEALVELALRETYNIDQNARGFGVELDSVADSLDWSDSSSLSAAGIDVLWVTGVDDPHRIYMHPDIVTSRERWKHVSTYLQISMVSDKSVRLLLPNLTRRRRPTDVPDYRLLAEASVLNRYLHLVRNSGLTGDRIIQYQGDLKTHGRGQNQSGQIGAAGASVAILAGLREISTDAIRDIYGTEPPLSGNSPSDLVRLMSPGDYEIAKCYLLSSDRAVVFSADPDVAIISRIGGGRSYNTAKEAYDEWSMLKRQPVENRRSILHQAALGEVKTALDPSNLHERLALGSRENRIEAGSKRFLMMAVLTEDILDPERPGRRAIYGRDAQRFEDIFNLYFLWGYDGARGEHHQHWEDFKTALQRWTGL